MLFGLTLPSRGGENRVMKTLLKSQSVIGATCCLVILTFIATTARAQTGTSTSAPPQPQTATTAPVVATSPVAAPSGQPSQADMMKMMMDMAKIGPNHKLLADTAGTWKYTLKSWMNPDPNAKPQESKGVAMRKMTLDGHYLTGDYVGKFEMPGPDGKMKNFAFHGMGVEGYDNVKKKFVASWIDNMGTAIQYYEGTWDDATKSWTYTYEMEPFPGMKMQARELIKVPDKDHMNFELYQTAMGQEKKTMEIDYTRAGKGK